MFGHNIARKWCFLSLRAERATVSWRSAIVKLVTLAEENQWKGGQNVPLFIENRHQLAFICGLSALCAKATHGMGLEGDLSPLLPSVEICLTKIVSHSSPKS